VGFVLRGLCRIFRFRDLTVIVFRCARVPSHNTHIAMGVGTILFWVCAALAIGGALGLITQRNPIYALLSLIVNFFAIGGLYLTLQAEFMAAVQVIVYAGAILVLFLFVIMLLNLQKSDMEPLKFDLNRLVAYGLGGVLIALFMFIFQGLGWLAPNLSKGAFTYGKVEPIGRLLMTDYVFPFEMISVLLLTALIGVVVLARKA